MQKLLIDIGNCQVCKSNLPLGPRPIVSAHRDASIAIIGQAPGRKVHASGIPWDDPSGKQLRKWLGVTDMDFYDPSKIALIPMGFCYPGKGKSGDLPPRKECAPLWHKPLLAKMPHLKLMLLIGIYAQKYYLKERAKRNLTQTVIAYQEYAPDIFPIPHPSPRNRFWLSKNPWFEQDLVPELQIKVRSLL